MNVTQADRPRGGSASVLIAALIYVGAWIVGLLVAPSAPSEGAADQKVQAFFVAHHGSTLVQALLVHGIAGLAFFVFVISLAKLMPAPGSGPMRTVFLVAGVAAVIVSLVQVGLEIGLNRHVAELGSALPARQKFNSKVDTPPYDVLVHRQARAFFEERLEVRRAHAGDGRDFCQRKIASQMFPDVVGHVT